MDKEAELRALRDQVLANTTANIHANKANIPANTTDAANKVDDIAVVKYLDTNRRKATTLDEVEVIDVIMRALFHEGRNRITGRIHAVSEQPKPKTDRREYQRELMRTRRKAERDGTNGHPDPDRSGDGGAGAAGDGQ
jgi:hypothetical protein